MNKQKSKLKAKAITFNLPVMRSLIFDEVIAELKKEKHKQFPLNGIEDKVNVVGWSDRAQMAIQACIDDVRKLKKINDA